MPDPKEIQIEMPVEDEVQPIPQVTPTSVEDEELVVYMPGDAVPEEPVVEADPSEVEQKLAELQQQLAAKSDQSTQIASGFAQMAEALQKSQAPAPAPVVAPQIDVEALNTRLKEKIYDNPAEAIGEMFQTFITPELKRQEAATAKLEFKNQRVDAMLANQDLFGKYGSEIDEVATSLGSYENAIAVVKGKHIDEIIEEKVKAAVTTAPAPTPKPQFTGVNEMPTSAVAPTKKVAVRLTPEELREAQMSMFEVSDWVKRERAKGRKFN